MSDFWPGVLVYIVNSISTLNKTVSFFLDVCIGYILIK